VKGCGRLVTSKAQRVRNNIQVGLKSIKNELALKTCLAKFKILFEKFDAQSLITDFFSFTISVPKKLQLPNQQDNFYLVFDAGKLLSLGMKLDFISQPSSKSTLSFAGIQHMQQCYVN